MRPTLVREFPILLLELVLNQILTSFLPENQLAILEYRPEGA